MARGQKQPEANTEGEARVLLPSGASKEIPLRSHDLSLSLAASKKEGRLQAGNSFSLSVVVVNGLLVAISYLYFFCFRVFPFRKEEGETRSEFRSKRGGARRLSFSLARSLARSCRPPSPLSFALVPC